MTTQTQPQSRNPYKRGNYLALFNFILSHNGKPFTREEMMNFARNELKMAENAAQASVTVILSPRETSEHGDCRGNYSAQGHVYFMHLLKEQMVKDENGKEIKAPQRYQLRWRKEVLAPFTRETAFLTAEQIAVLQESKAKAKAEAAALKATIEQDRAARRAAREARKAEDAEKAIARQQSKAEKTEAAKAKALENIAAKAARQQQRDETRKAKADAYFAARQQRDEKREEKRQNRLALAKVAAQEKAAKAQEKAAKAEAEAKAKADAEAKAKAEAEADAAGVAAVQAEHAKTVPNETEETEETVAEQA